MAWKKRDLTGQRFGGLTVVEEAGRYKNGQVLWKCICNCGRETVVIGTNMTLGRTKSCGHCYSNDYRLSDAGSHMIMTFPNGAECLIDIDDYKRVSAHTWHPNSSGYVQGYINGKYVSLHRFIIGAPANLQVDHINLDRNNNRKSNLRLATIIENSRNEGLRTNNTSGAKGVYYDKRRKKYITRITIDGKTIYLGQYSTVIEASDTYDRAAIKHFGEFAWLNSLEEKTLEQDTSVFASAAK